MIEAATFSIDVPDLRAGTEFYADGLGFVVVGDPSGDSVHLRAGDVRVDLLERAAGSPAVPDGSAERDYGRHWTPVHLDLVVSDLERAVEDARAAGATLESERETDEGERIAGCVDPFGNGFCLIEYPAE